MKSPREIVKAASLYPLLLVTVALLITSFAVEPVSAKSLMKRASFYIANETVCVVDGVVFHNSDPIPSDDPCETCKCRPPGFACVLRKCEVKAGCKAVRKEGECCPQYVCGCEHNGIVYSDGEVIRNTESPCYTCYCHGSSIACALVDCYFRHDCAPKYVPGECCPRYDDCPPEKTIRPFGQNDTRSTTSLPPVTYTYTPRVSSSQGYSYSAGEQKNPDQHIHFNEVPLDQPVVYSDGGAVITSVHSEESTEINLIPDLVSTTTYPQGDKAVSSTDASSGQTEESTAKSTTEDESLLLHKQDEITIPEKLETVTSTESSEASSTESVKEPSTAPPLIELLLSNTIKSVIDSEITGTTEAASPTEIPEKLETEKSDVNKEDSLLKSGEKDLEPSSSVPTTLKSSDEEVVTKRSSDVDIVTTEGTKLPLVTEEVTPNLIEKNLNEFLGPLEPIVDDLTLKSVESEKQNSSIDKVEESYTTRIIPVVDLEGREGYIEISPNEKETESDFKEIYVTSTQQSPISHKEQTSTDDKIATSDQSPSQSEELTTVVSELPTLVNEPTTKPTVKLSSLDDLKPVSNSSVSVDESSTVSKTSDDEATTESKASYESTTRVSQSVTDSAELRENSDDDSKIEEQSKASPEQVSSIPTTSEKPKDEEVPSKIKDIDTLSSESVSESSSTLSPTSTNPKTEQPKEIKYDDAASLDLKTPEEQTTTAASTTAKSDTTEEVAKTTPGVLVDLKEVVSLYVAKENDEHEISESLKKLAEDTDKQDEGDSEKNDKLKKQDVDKSKNPGVEESKKPDVEESKKPDVEESKKQDVEESKKQDVEESKKQDVEESKKQDVEESKKQDVEHSKKQDEDYYNKEEAEDLKEEVEDLRKQAEEVKKRADLISSSTDSSSLQKDQVTGVQGLTEISQADGVTDKVEQTTVLPVDSSGDKSDSSHSHGGSLAQNNFAPELSGSVGFSETDNIALPIGYSNDLALDIRSLMASAENSIQPEPDNNDDLTAEKTTVPPPNDITTVVAQMKPVEIEKSVVEDRLLELKKESLSVTSTESEDVTTTQSPLDFKHVVDYVRHSIPESDLSSSKEVSLTEESTSSNEETSASISEESEESAEPTSTKIPIETTVNEEESLTSENSKDLSSTEKPRLDFIHFYNHNPMEEVETKPIEVVESKPIEDVVSKPIEEVKSKPIEEVNSKPIEEVKSKPIEEVKSKPIEEVESKTIEEVESKPIEEVESKPIEEVDSKPIEEVDSKPIEEVDSKPIEEVDSKSIEEVDSKSIEEVGSKQTEEVESKPIEEVESKPIVEVESKPIVEVESKPIVEVESKSIVEVESKPIVEVESKPIEEVESKPIEEAELKPIEEVKFKPIEEVKSKPIENFELKPIDKVESKPVEGEKLTSESSDKASSLYDEAKTPSSTPSVEVEGSTKQSVPIYYGEEIKISYSQESGGNVEPNENKADDKEKQLKNNLVDNANSTSKSNSSNVVTEVTSQPQALTDSSVDKTSKISEQSEKVAVESKEPEVPSLRIITSDESKIIPLLYSDKLPSELLSQSAPSSEQSSSIDSQSPELVVTTEAETSTGFASSTTPTSRISSTLGYKRMVEDVGTSSAFVVEDGKLDDRQSSDSTPSTTAESSTVWESIKSTFYDLTTVSSSQAS